MMDKRIFFVLFWFCLAVNTYGQNKINITVTNFESNKGVCRLCLFNSEESFAGKGAPVKCLQSVISKQTSYAVIEGVPAGNYAIAVFHDKNSNGKMDTNFLGMPKEGYGASKNKLPFASAPTFKENQFFVGRHSTIGLTIRLRNL